MKGKFILIDAPITLIICSARLSFLSLVGAVLLSIQTVNAQDYSTEVLLDGLDQPWSMAFLPNGDYLMAFLGGELRRISANDKEISDPIKNAPETYAAGQGGYFDVILDPNFAANQTIYLSFAEGRRTSNATRVISAQLKDDALVNVTPIFTIKDRKDTSAHYGGRLLMLKDATILLTTGDGFQYREAAQDPRNQLGKIVRFNRDGSAPDDNPAKHNASLDPFVYTVGHRNPQGLALDTATNTIFMHEHGPKGGDEVNIIVAGENYGWPATSYGVNYSGARVSPYEKLDWVKDALHYWTPSIAPSGLTVYQGDVFPDWQGDLFVGALAEQEVRRLDIENGLVVNEETLLTNLKQRVRSVYTGPDGYIYILTESKNSNGKLIRITP